MRTAHLMLTLGVEVELSEGVLFVQAVFRQAVSEVSARLLLELDGVPLVDDCGRGRFKLFQHKVGQAGVQHSVYDIDRALVGSGTARAAAHVVPALRSTKVVVAPFVVGIGFMAGVFHLAIRAGKTVGAYAGAVGTDAVVLAVDGGAGVVVFAGGHEHP